jgi:hypothetical protein
VNVSTTSFTVAEYCQQMESHSITINRDYQRSPKRWPQAARSFLIDTILTGYPIPKLSLHQKTDLKSKKTIKEIVDGQQRSVAILEFYQNKLRVTGASAFAGKLFSQLDPEEQHAFLAYSLSADIFVGVSDGEIREVFRRINSYTVPLNKQEQRHAIHQGLFKWFIFDQTKLYSDTLKTLGVFHEQQLSRMADGALLTEFCRSIVDGIATHQEGNLNRFYADREKEFPEAKELEKRIKQVVGEVVKYADIHNGPLMKPDIFLTLILAISHRLKEASPLNAYYEFDQEGALDEELASTNFSALASAIEQGAEEAGPLAGFASAAAKGTNTETNRSIRFQYFCRAIEDDLPE